MKVLCNFFKDIYIESATLIQDRTNNYYILVCRVLILLGIFFSPISMFHIEWVPSYISVFLSYIDKLSMYPLLLFSLLWLIKNIGEKRIKLYIPLGIFFIVYFVINIVIVIHGDMIFPYYNIADYSKLSGGDAIAFRFISSIFNFSTSKANWILSNVCKSCITITTGFYCSYFIIFSIVLFYVETKKDYIHDAWIAISCVLPFIFIYEIFEFAYLGGKEWGAGFLQTVNPLLYPIDFYPYEGEWWPPVFWDQVRSVFVEPSYLSYWGALTLPIFMINVLEKRKVILNSLELFFITFIVLSSFARTGAALVIGCNVVFIILSIVKMKRKAFLQVFIFIFILCFSIFGASSFVSFSKTNIRMEKAVKSVESKVSDSNVDNYLSGTVGSLTKEESRSNKSRFSVARAQLDVFLDHPILGVSEQLLGQYVYDELDDMDGLNAELKRWQNRQSNGAIVNSNIPSLNEYFYTLASGGIVLFFADSFLLLGLAAFSSFIFLFRKQCRTRNMLVSISLSAVVIAFGLSSLFSTNFLYFIVFSYLILANLEISNFNKSLLSNAE